MLDLENQLVIVLFICVYLYDCKYNFEKSEIKII